MNARRAGWWTGLVVAAMMAATVALGVAAYRGAGPASPQEVMERNRVAYHQGQHDPCATCAAVRDWARENPGRWPGDVLDAAEEGVKVVDPPPGD